MLTGEENKKWYALYVSSRQEKKVMELLVAKNVEAYVPLIRTIRQWSDRKKVVELPLFSGYVFARLAVAEQQKAIETRGVVNYVHDNGKKAIVKDKEIASLKQLISLGYQMETMSMTAVFKEGDRVKVTSSVLKGVEGYVVDTKSGRFIEVALESIGQIIKVKLPQQILTTI